MNERYSAMLIEFFEKMSAWENKTIDNREISLAQMHLVEIIGSNGSLRMKDLAEKLHVTTGSLTVMTKRLIESDYLDRQIDENDKRSYFIKLTQKGQEEYRIHHRQHRKLIDEILNVLGPDDSDLFFNRLEKIASCLKEMA